jgi:NAD(P)-dependent dehydrogenase (short-subunit alcohol dehydrogenase family)
MSERTVLITGGTGAVGGAVVEAMLEDGWQVVATWVMPEERDRMREREGLELVKADLLHETEVNDAVTRAAFGRGGLRAVVNLVGGFSAGAPCHETSLEDFERLFRLNLRPTFLVTRAAVPFMLDAGGGSIVCVSARAAVQPFGGAAGYISSKAAVLAFAQAVAADYRDRGVRCNAILPSVVDTAANRTAQPDADHSRWVAPDEIAAVIRFLCSDDSAPVSGAAIPVYGRA